MARTTLFTCSIYPDLTRVWYHFVRRYVDSSEVETLIYDCGSRLRAADFPGARIVRFPNKSHGEKIDHALKHDVQTELFFLCDDDTFLINAQAEPTAAEGLLANEKCAAYSLRPRGWWEWSIGGATHPVMGSYCLVFKPEIFRRERLSFRVRRTSDLMIRKGQGGYYDTADYANEQLIRRGYEIVTADEATRARFMRSFSAISSGFVTYARRSWWSKQYVLKNSHTRLAETLRASERELERTCGVTATLALYRAIFKTEPQFTDFFTFAELHEIAQTFRGDAAQNELARKIVVGYEDMKNLLESRA